ncbi:MAG: hypothetical protein V3U76_02400 [Granulosicoccus sp.]
MTVVAIVVYSDTLVLPLFLGLLTWGKAFLKSLTPKFALLLLKNSIFIQIRRLVTSATAHFFVKSHKPWRRWLTNAKTTMLIWLKHVFAGYMSSPLWLRTGIALALLLATAGSSAAVFALMIIPQPVLNWLRQQVMTLMNKLGVAQLIRTLWNFVIPGSIRHRWHMYVKWTLGRRQVLAARQLHAKVRASSRLPR